MDMEKLIIDLLVRYQNHDGSWGYYQQSPGFIEPTVYALLSLYKKDDESFKRGLRWLLNQQNENGSFVNIDINSTWPSFWVYFLMSVINEEAIPESILIMKWIISHRGKGAAFSQDLSNKDLLSLGWPWYKNTTSWVEPTSYALIALKHRATTDSRTIKIIKNAEQFILARACNEGGWNAGNSMLFDTHLSSYPTSTAFALLSLQDHQENSIVLEGLYSFLGFLKQTISPYLLGLGVIILYCFNEDYSDVLRKLYKYGEYTSWDSNYIPSLALALISSCVENFNPFAMIR